MNFSGRFSEAYSMWLFALILLLVVALIGWWWFVGYKHDKATAKEAFDINSTSFDESVNIGRREAVRTKVVIVGMIRDGELRIRGIIPKVEELGNLFADYRVLVVENDSKDNTRALLQKWREKNPRVTILGCGVNAAKCTMNLPATPNHDSSWRRIWKMATLRNVYMDYLDSDIIPSFHPDYVIGMDMDLDASIYPDGVLSSLGFLSTDPHYSALCANSVNVNLTGTHFYDSFPLIRTSPPDADDWKDTDEKIVHDHAVFDWAKKYLQPGKGVVQVRSCFSGMTIYRARDIAGKRYSPPPDGRVGCEHTYLNRQLPGSIGVNSDMVVWVRQI